jgi:hypothetical protein
MDLFLDEHRAVVGYGVAGIEAGDSPGAGKGWSRQQKDGGKQETPADTAGVSEGRA